MKNLKYFLIFLFFVSACKVPDYVPLPKDYKYNVKGSYVMIKTKDDKDIVGEIIVVNDKSISLLPTSSQFRKIITIVKRDDLEFDILLCSSSDEPEAITAWASALTLTSIGHGKFLVFSAPINIATGFGMAADVKSPYSVRYPKGIDWRRLHKFARYPQGLPEGVDLSMIR